MIQFKNLPAEIQNRMLDEQERQGNPRNAEVFEEDIAACDDEGGFTWGRTEEGHAFWREILAYDSLANFYEKYPKRPCSERGKN